MYTNACKDNIRNCFMETGCFLCLFVKMIFQVQVGQHAGEI